MTDPFVKALIIVVILFVVTWFFDELSKTKDTPREACHICQDEPGR